VAPYKRVMGVKIVWQPPLTPYSGLVFRRYECKYVKELTDKKEIATELIAFLRTQYRWGMLSFDPLVTDMQPFIWNGFKVNVRYTYVLDLSDMERVWSNISSNARQVIGKAQRDGLMVIAAESFDDMLDLVNKTYQRQKRHFFSLNSLNKYHDALLHSNLCKGFLCLDKEGNKIASDLIVWDHRTVYGVISGYDEKKKHRGAGFLCGWEIIKFISQALGYKTYDLGGSMIPRFEDVLRRYGGKLTPYYRISWGKGIESIFNIRLLLNRVTGL
jgi:hypothetical protein